MHRRRPGNRDDRGVAGLTSVITKRGAIKIALVAVFIAVIAGIYFSPLRDHLSRAQIQSDVGVLRTLWYGPVALIAAYAAGCVFALPASLFIITAGVVWGWKFGTLYAMCGAMIGASLAYFVGRFVGEGLLEKFGRAGRAVESTVKTAGFKTMLVVRLIPGPPFAVWNYGAGVANVKFRDYFFGTLLGTLPAHLIFAYCADSLFNGTMTEGAAIRRLAIVAALLIALIFLPNLLKKRVRPAE
ncbi:MAG TPA: TVP38/TMEM64 family protein [Thermoanaerobaculia bacterium]